MNDTLTVRMKTLAAGPEGNLEPGKDYTLPREQANQLIAGGYASLVGVGASQPQPLENAAGRRQAETAAVNPPAATAVAKDKAAAKSKSKPKGAGPAAGE